MTIKLKITKDAISLETEPLALLREDVGIVSDGRAKCDRFLVFPAIFPATHTVNNFRCLDQDHYHSLELKGHSGDFCMVYDQDVRDLKALLEALLNDEEVCVYWG